MKLLYDNNLSHKLVARLDDIFPYSTHVMMENLDESEDQKIGLFAKEKDYTIVTKDADYNEISVFKGFPPKIIWLTVGNCRVQDVERIIRNKTIVINDFYQNENAGIIEFN